MKKSTVIHWTFENSGTPADSSKGEGSYQDLAVALVKWMAGVTMNYRISVIVNRGPNLEDEDDPEKLLATLLAAAGLDAEEK